MSHETDQALLALYERDGVLTPEQVVKEARPKSSPLHSRFEWDDKRAGHLYRVEQARELIRRVEAVIAERPIRRYVYVPSETGYHDVERVMSRDDWRDQALADFQRDAERFAARWAAHRDVADAYRSWAAQQAS